MAIYIVTGCAGFIGSHLSEALIDRGDDVVAIDSFSAYYDRTLNDHNLGRLREESAFTLVELDLSAASLDDVASGADGIFHLAAQPGVRASWGHDFDPYVRDNVLATQRMFELACQPRASDRVGVVLVGLWQRGRLPDT